MPQEKLKKKKTKQRKKKERRISLINEIIKEKICPEKKEKIKKKTNFWKNLGNFKNRKKVTKEKI